MRDCPVNTHRGVKIFYESLVAFCTLNGLHWQKLLYPETLVAARVLGWVLLSWLASAKGIWNLASWGWLVSYVSLICLTQSIVNNLPLGKCWYLCLEPDVCLCSICVVGADFLLLYNILYTCSCSRRDLRKSHLEWCIISKVVLINSGENVVDSPGATETIPLTAPASWEKSEPLGLFSRGHADSHFVFICKAKASYSTWAITSEHNLEQSCRTAAQDPAFPWGGCMPSQFPGVCRVGLSCLRATSSSVLEGCHCCPGTVLLDTAPAAHTQCPHTPNFAFPSPPATAELTDGCTNLLCRCLGCLRRAFHPSSSEMYL